MFSETMMALLVPLTLFAFTASSTPGPNNILLTTSGANFGFRRTLPFVIGVRCGFTLIQILVILGLGGVFLQYPEAHTLLKYLGSAYLLVLAWKIANMPPPNANDGKAKPLSIIEGALFQFVNPKTWIVIISSTTAYTLGGDEYFSSAIMLIIVFNLVGIPAAIIWIQFGAAISKLFKTEQAWRYFNRTMAVLTLASISLLFI
ncbi:LysE family translocator [Flocculibacter collagenilyticus]|uniref:LysE family translocator n=1 Tax=Flocculibacter collagenilyticus TaxID=2744479 RepID=UPI0018F67305|nr:LysE family translocator [Flocculibacter collagenilyticus]